MLERVEISLKFRKFDLVYNIILTTVNVVCLIGLSHSSTFTVAGVKFVHYSISAPGKMSGGPEIL